MTTVLRIGICVAAAVLLLLGKETVLFAASVFPIQTYVPTTQILWIPYVVVGVIVFPCIAWCFSLIKEVRTMSWIILTGALYLAMVALSLGTLAQVGIKLLLLNCLLAAAFFLAGLFFVRPRSAHTAQ
jgi:hypothetical protein